MPVIIKNILKKSLTMYFLSVILELLKNDLRFFHKVLTIVCLWSLSSASTIQVILVYILRDGC
jgi:hypothetical protein